MPLPLIGGALSDAFLSDVSLSVAYVGPRSRTERSRKTKIGTEVAHRTRDSDTTFKVQRSRHYQSRCFQYSNTGHQAALLSVAL